MLPNLKTANFADPLKAEDIRRLQANVREATNAVLANPLLDGRFVTDVDLIAGATTINHGLGRTLTGWIPTRISAQATISDLQASNDTPQLTLVLESSAPCTVNLWVF